MYIQYIVYTKIENLTHVYILSKYAFFSECKLYVKFNAINLIYLYHPTLYDGVIYHIYQNLPRQMFTKKAIFFIVTLFSLS